MNELPPSSRSRQGRLRPRLAAVFVTVVAAPALLIVLVLAWVSYQQTAGVARDLTNARLTDFHLRIGERVRSQFELTRRLAQLNAHRIREGELPQGDLPDWRGTLFRQLEAFPSVSAIAWGSENGSAIWLGRRAGEQSFVMGLKGRPDGTLAEYKLLADGGVGPVIGSSEYQPQQRPWYAPAAAARRPVWTSPWVWSSTDTTREPTLAIAHSVPVIDEAGRLQGVVDAETTLHDLSAFLRDVVGESQVLCFVVDHRGHLLASSAKHPVVNIDGAPQRAADSTDALIRSAADSLPPPGPADAASIRTPSLASGTVELPAGKYRVLGSVITEGESLTLNVYTTIDEQLIVRGDEVAARNTFTYGLLAVLAAIAVGGASGSLLVRPVHAVVRHVRRVARGDFHSRLRLSGVTELSELASELNTMSVALAERLDLRHSLQLAKNVQRALLPSASPAVPGLEIYGYSSYCDDTGGDCYDYFDLATRDPNRVNVAVGDVSGHGIAAAMLMASARGLLRSHAGQTDSVADLLTHVNHHLCRDLCDGRFMTMLLASIDVPMRQLRWASAGHGSPLLYDPSADRFEILDACGVPLGIDPDGHYAEGLFDRLSPGQVLFLGTDGVWETRRARGGDLFDHVRLRDHIRKAAHLPAEEIGKSLCRALDEFRGQTRPHDDVTFVVIKVT